MNKEYLQDYEAYENEQIEIMKNRILKKEVNKDEQYPPRDRFNKIQDPIGRSIPITEIWPLIPIFGSLIVHLVPVNKKECNHYLGFNASDIDRLIDYSKDTGKIQFVLSKNPILFEGYDYFEPIFSELKPPQLYSLPREMIMTEQESQEFQMEFTSYAANEQFLKYFERYRSWLGFSRERLEDTISNYAQDYSLLRKLGYDEITDEINNYLVNDIEKALKLFQLYGLFITSPYLDLTRNIRNYSIDMITDFNKISKKPIDIVLPLEVGKYLINKTSLIPESFEACRDIVGKYEQEDMYKVFTNLNEGIKNSKIDLIMNNINELNTIMDNVWEDNQINKRVNYMEYGLPVSLAVTGALAGGLIGGMGGLLAGLGFSVVDKMISNNMESISERVAKYFAPNHLVGIFDFKKKYKLK
jgi:hypothetical protein